MTREKLHLLQQELLGLQHAARHLGYSVERCHDVIGQQNPSPEQLERMEALASRFARLADLLIQRMFRLIDDIELIGAGSLLDRIYRAEKRGFANADELIKIRELRNLIAHEYAADKMPELYATVMAMSPALLAIVPRVTAYTDAVIRRYPA